MRLSPADDADATLRQHGQAVWGLVVRLVGDDGPDAADCFQQAFVELASMRRAGDAIGDDAALLKRIAARRAVDAVRRRVRYAGGRE